MGTTPDGAWDGKGKEPASLEAGLKWLAKQGVSTYTIDGIRRTRARATSIPDAGWWRVMAGNTAEDTPAEYKAAQERRVTAAKTRQAADKNADRTVDNAEKAVYVAEGGDPGDLESLGIPSISELEGNSSRGAPLLPYGGEVPADFTVENQSRGRSSFSPYMRQLQQNSPERVGIRYYEQDLLRPLAWSEEARADLQRKMYTIGLYGDSKVTLGVWTERDQAVYAELLQAANMSGRTATDQLNYWKIAPPVDLLDQIRGDQPKKPTLQVTNPLDIREAARGVSRGLTGREDRGFVEGSVTGYQGMETAAQQGMVADQEAGGGGTVTQAASMDAYLADKLRREQPLEVDGYAFVQAFDTFAQMIGGAG